MKRYILCLSILLSLSAKSQNWLPINTAKDYNFTLGNGELIMRTISTTQSNDTVFFETVLDSCFTCSYLTYSDTFLLNQADFLGFYMLNSFDTSYTFYGRDTFTIKTNVALGDTWAYSSIRTALVVSEGEQFFGSQADSIKTIWLGGSDTLVLSKENGLIRFPSIIRNRLYKQLGIEGVYGAQDLTFWDIYNFEVGDIFQFILSSATSEQSRFEYRKIQIQGKELGLDYLKYFVSIDSKYSFDIHPIYYYSSYSDTLLFNYLDYLNIRIGSGGVVSLIAGGGGYASSFYSLDTDHNLIKKVDLALRYSSEMLGLNQLISINDSICIYDGEILNYDIQYKAGLGKILDSQSYFETGESLRLLGYYKGTDTIGTVYPDQFYVGINDRPNINEMIKFYPNPVEDDLWIEVLNNDELLIELRDVFGQVVWSREIDESAQFDLNNLSKGIYFLQACTQGISCASAKLIKNY